jgi:hypothetical protein
MPRYSDPNAWFLQALKLAEDAAASDWLKNALVAAINRDPIEAAADAEVLGKILRQRASAVSRPATRSSQPSKTTKLST